MAAFLHIAHARVPEADRQAQLRRLAAPKKRRAHGGASHPEGHRVEVPDDVQAFLAAHTRNVKHQDFKAILEQHSEKFLAYGQTRYQTVSMLQRVFRGRQVDNYEVVLTRFDRNGNMAKIDGYVQHKGFRTPLMITDIIKEADNRWRWYGDQQ